MDRVVVHLHAAVSLLGRFPALAGVDLDVADGEIVLVQGPNGAGKTTLLRACAGLVPVIDGEASVLGHDLRRDRRSVRRHVALLGHETGLYDDLTVADNLRFVARATRRASAPSVEEALGRLGLAGRLAGVQVARLSAGQRRRVAFCCGRPTCGSSTSPTPGSTPTVESASMLWCERRRSRAPLCCWPPTSSTGHAPSPPGSSPWPAVRSGPR